MVAQWTLWCQGPSGEDPWTTMCPPDPFPACMGLKNRIFLDKFCKNRIVPLMDELRSQLGARKSKCCRNLTTKNSKSENFDFPKLGPARLWDIGGMVGCAETCFYSLRAPRALLPPQSWRCATVRWDYMWASPRGSSGYLRIFLRSTFFTSGENQKNTVIL